MNYATATRYRTAARTTDGAEESPCSLAAGVEERQACQTDRTVAAMQPGSTPDPTWDRVTHASWESFPASDAPGWR
jgi:hypothetical protein